MKIFYKYIKKYWKVGILILFLAMINQGFSFLDPYIFRIVIDNFASKPELYTKAEFFTGVGKLLLAIIGVAFISRVAKNFQDYFLNSITQKVGADIYQNGVKHVLSLPYKIFENERSGETLGKLQKARQDTEKLIISLVNVLFVSIFGFILVSIYAFSIYWGIALAFFLTIPIIGGLSLVLSGKIKKIQQVIFTETAALSGSTTESLRNVELVKTMGLGDQEIERLNDTTDKILKLELKKLKYLRSLSFVQGTVINLIRTLILAFMLYLIFTKTITFGEFFSLFIYSFFVFGPLQEIGNVITTYRETEASLLNFQDLLDLEPEKNPETELKMDNLQEISFENVSFEYQTKKDLALSNISFKVKKGQTISFVGPSGSGKTSLVKLLVGLYEPKSGEIWYNNLKHFEINKKQLREKIGFVTQETQLFAGTLADNLRFVKKDATDQQCLDALIKAQCQSLLEKSGDGLQTIIGEGGLKLSGGEKQRLSIARAILRNPDLLVFDEATSALDSLTEKEITTTVKELSIDASRIIILIAHRLSTIMHSDIIFVLEKGKIVEFGNHQYLLDQKGLYFAMWRQQIGER